MSMKEITITLKQITLKTLHIFKADSFYRKTNEGEFLKENPDMPDDIASRKIGRNDPCPCGSGKKYKKCCKDI